MVLLRHPALFEPQRPCRDGMARLCEFGRGCLLHWESAFVTHPIWSSLKEAIRCQLEFNE